jgi:DNA-binding response OmpR family regulator
VRILVIEDEARILGFVASGLEAEGFAVTCASDGEEGLKRALQEPVELVILDLLLPRLDGLTLLRTLRLHQPELPVVILSARSELETKLLAFELGANDYLAKPFSFDELLARVRAQLRSRRAENGDLLHAGNLTLDVGHREARLGDTVTHLSEREFRLLRYLVEHAGEVVSQERLLSEVWAYTFDPGSNVVEVYMRRLRRKLGPEAGIETVRNAGYRLAAA